ncbi:MAG: trehalose-6-phosphate synthase [Gammaproteobacteria bacterium]|nr:trehalose-6-phosphate synthase [Gammaproteobacteria bacterium]
MSRIIAVSNRVPVGGKSSGGLAVGVLAALEEYGGVWFGWNGEIVDGDMPDPEIERRGRVTYATLPLNRQDFDDYYNGFSNNILWPLFHFQLGVFSYDRRQFEAYCRVNALFARKLAPLIEPGDLIWVHDYHLILLASELRRAGIEQPIGFFLHVPFPGVDVLRALPPYQAMLRGLCAYDVVGFQTQRDLRSFEENIAQQDFGDAMLADRRVGSKGCDVHADVFPIGIDVAGIKRLAQEAVGTPPIARMADSLHGRQLVIGVDRLDYSKGLPERFRAYERLLEQNTDLRGELVFMQIAPPSRTGVRAYVEIREELEQTAGNINGRYAEMDWMPIRYLNRKYSRRTLMGLLRIARVAVVTPLRDGMNLVAKEYVAAQDPENPGALVLSTLAGAARELDDATLVNPYDIEDVSEGIMQAIAMPLAERRERHRAMIEALERNDITRWRTRFVDALSGC